PKHTKNEVRYPLARLELSYFDLSSLAASLQRLFQLGHCRSVSQIQQSIDLLWIEPQRAARVTLWQVARAQATVHGELERAEHRQGDRRAYACRGLGNISAIADQRR